MLGTGSTGEQQTDQKDIISEQHIDLVNVQPNGSFQQFLVSQNQIDCVQYGTHYKYTLDDNFLLPGAHVSGTVHDSNGNPVGDTHQYQELREAWTTGICGVQPPGPNGLDIIVVPNGSGGVLVASETNDDQNPVWIKNVPQPSVSGDGTEIHLTTLDTINNLVLGENGNAFAAGTWNFFETARLVSFNLNSGATNWTYESPFSTPDEPGYVDIVAAGPNNSLYATEGDFFEQTPENAFTLDANGARTDNPTSSQAVTSVTSAGLGGNIWLGQNLNQVASLGGFDLGFGMPALMQSGVQLGVPGMTAYASTLVDTILSTFPAPSPSGDEGQRCAPLDKPTSNTLSSAYESNKNFLSNTNNCSACDTKIFHPLKLTRSNFVTYLKQTPKFCDGTKSQEPGTTIGQNTRTVAAYFKQQQQANAGLTAVTVPVGPTKPLWIFFDPAQINNDSSSVDPHLYPSMMFHEGLHGYTQIGDSDPFNVHGGGLCEILKISLEPQFSNCAVHTVFIT